MQSAVEYGLEGEYESGHDGASLDILDLGANIGSFALWANMRWPNSRIRCYEPNPGTFACLKRNTAHLPNIMAFNVAVFPGTKAREPFFARYDGDREAGLARYACDTFTESAMQPAIEVDVVDPSKLTSPDIVKIDIEGGEAAVLAALDLSNTALVLAEFQNRRNRLAMQEVLARNFVAILDEESPWDPILDNMDYRRDLKGDVFGRMFYARSNPQSAASGPSRPGAASGLRLGAVPLFGCAMPLGVSASVVLCKKRKRSDEGLSPSSSGNWPRKPRIGHSARFYSHDN
jgi:FkbM family methyltransferase